MKLVNLEPRWVHPDILIFECPHCQKVWLSCKKVEMAVRDQMRVFSSLTDVRGVVIPCKPEMAWSISGTLPDLSILPALDASESGHWHGFITEGETK